jgi:acetyl-CoA synthetase
MSYPFQITSYAAYKTAYKKSVDEPAAFWNEIAQHFLWKKPPTQTLEWNFTDPSVKFFEDGILNITENCIDRHLAERGQQPALIWEPNNPDEAHRVFTYAQLYEEVCAMATVLRNHGIKKGDRVCIYMGMVPELSIALLACARIGAIHSVIFGGFSAQSIADRIQDAGAVAVITCDGAYRGAKDIPLKQLVDEAIEDCPTVKKVWVLTRTKIPVSMMKNRDYFLEQEIEDIKRSGKINYEAEPMMAEDPLFILYTSGSTGKPKGVVHSCAGYMIYTTYTFVNVFQYQPGDVHFCTADIGWITGHSYIVYGPLCAGATSLMFEGIPTYPDAGRLWDVVDKHQVNILYTAPTAIRSLMQAGLQPLNGKDLSSLKVLGTVGEPINEEAWNWYDTHIGKGKCPIVDTWWQTETGGVLISNLAGITPAKPSYATLPMPGVQPILLDDQARVITENNVNGNLCIRFPWPSILRTTYGDHERCKQNYFTTYPNLYFTGDGAFRDENGFYRITGRVDDVLNVSGHRIGTAEVENAINMHAGVVESAVVGYAHDVKGQGIYAYVVFNGHHHMNEAHTQMDIAATVTKIIGAIARPDKIQLVNGLPKTRSGKIMRRILRKIAEGDVDQVGDTTTLLDPAIVDEIKLGRLS